MSSFRAWTGATIISPAAILLTTSGSRACSELGCVEGINDFEAHFDSSRCCDDGRKLISLPLCTPGRLRIFIHRLGHQVEMRCFGSTSESRTGGLVMRIRCFCAGARIQSNIDNEAISECLNLFLSMLVETGLGFEMKSESAENAMLNAMAIS